MIIIKLAWDTLRFNIKRTMMLILVLIVAITSLLLFRGYINYSAEGMKMGFVAQNGALQIAHKDFWSVTSETKPLLKEADNLLLKNILDEAYGIDSYLKLLTINGLIGTSQRSKFFTGDAYEYILPSIYQIADIGTNQIINEEGIILGKGLVEYLGIEVNDYVTLLGSGRTGIALISLPLAGSISVGNRDADNMLGFMTLDTAHRFYNMTDEFDRLRVDINNINDINSVRSNIESKLLGTELEVKDWIELNPSYTDINEYNEGMSLWTTIIFVIFILIAVSQMFQISFMQRIGELGTLRAIGFRPNDVFKLLLSETILTAIISCIVGVTIFYIFSFLANVFDLQFSPPMSGVSYPLRFIIYFSDMVLVGGIISITTIVSCLYPAYQAVSKPIVEVIRHV